MTSKLRVPGLPLVSIFDRRSAELAGGLSVRGSGLPGYRKAAGDIERPKVAALKRLRRLPAAFSYFGHKWLSQAAPIGAGSPLEAPAP